MNTLGHLWDDTFAGPFPESGLRKLRLFPSPTSSSFSTATATSPAEEGGRKTARKAGCPEQPRYPTAFDWVVISALDR
ncbi:hypothetical protein HPP92_027604 [Vanilla planifolia]|uniref:Uncharacterized protein n=1 Tax=Vanilla planifolia TaxID=51239 RepID=A0A835PC91_VANPL|nr:hypothetical protein HPP92_027604 [Vanilla planifolia]KAG0448959.1 hypothetical protein HPP92_027601 [Vanilla planifolia]